MSKPKTCVNCENRDAVHYSGENLVKVVCSKFGYTAFSATSSCSLFAKHVKPLTK